MRVIFTATSGNDTRHVLERFVSHVREQHKRSVVSVRAENQLYELTKNEFYEFLEDIPSSKAARLWSSSLKAAIGTWKKEVDALGTEPDFSFLSLHATYHVRSHLYCPLNWCYTDQPGSVARAELLEALREFSPDLFINLYDNVYSLQARIKNYPFRLIELLRWRNVETLTTDIFASLIEYKEQRIRENPSDFARYQYERSPIVAIRHPLEMIYKLISDEKAHRIYMAYPISSLNTRPGALSYTLPAGEVRRAVEEKPFWAGTDKGGEIDNQIVRRDFRLIDQSDCIVIYRPTMNRSGGWQLGGTRREYEHAKNSNKPAIVVWDKTDGPLEDPPFNTNVNGMDIFPTENLDDSEAVQEQYFRKLVGNIRIRIAEKVGGLAR